MLKFLYSIDRNPSDYPFVVYRRSHHTLVYTVLTQGVFVLLLRYTSSSTTNGQVVGKRGRKNDFLVSNTSRRYTGRGLLLGTTENSVF